METHAQTDRPAPGSLLAEVGEATLARNVAAVQATLRANPYGDCPPARLVAVTKTVTAQTVARLGALGMLDIGENRVQVALPKLAALSERTQFRLHWIGRLQTNKVKDIIDQVWLLHAMDRLALAQEVERRADERGLTLNALVQVNIAGESQKAGFAPEEVRPFLRRMKDYQSLRIRGLMAILPLTDDAALLTGYFRRMRTLFDELAQEALPSVTMAELSMGMSQDHALAAREGATLVRVGTALFQN